MKSHASASKSMEKRLHVALLANSYAPHVGGVETAVQEIAHQLCNLGHRVTVIAPRNPLSLPGYESDDGLVIRRVPMFMPGVSMKPGGKGRIIAAAKLLLAPALPAVYLYIAAMLGNDRPDIVNVHYVGANALCGVFLSGLLNIPLVVNIHGEDIERDPVRSLLCRQLVKLTLQQSEAVLCNSAYLGQLADRLAPGIADKLRVVGNGVRLRDFEQAQPFNGAGPYILGIGRFVNKKGFDQLIGAFAQTQADLGNAKLILAGDGPERAFLEELAAKHGIGGQVDFVGYVDHNRVIDLMKGARMIVIPSRKEPFGIVAIEAMAAGTPLVATAVGGLCQVVKHRQDGLLVPADSPEKLAQAMITLWKNTDLQTKLVQAGRKKVEKQYTWAAVTERIVDEYVRVLSSHNFSHS